MKKTIVRIAECRECLGTGVAVQTSLQGFAGLDEILPMLEVVGIGFLLNKESEGDAPGCFCRVHGRTYHFSIVLAHSRVLLIGAAIVTEVAHFVV